MERISPPNSNLKSNGTEKNGSLSSNKVRPDNADSSMEMGRVKPGEARELAFEIDRSGLQKLVPALLRTRFSDKSLERFFSLYTTRQKKGAIFVLILFSFAIQISMTLLNIMSIQAGGIYRLIVGVVFLVLNIALAMFFLINTKKRFISDKRFPKIAAAFWCYCAIQVVVAASINYHPRSPSDLLGWVLALSYVTYVTVPVRLLVCVGLALVFCLCHVLTTAISSARQGVRDTRDLGLQVLANILLYVCANVLGFISFVIIEIKQRRSFIEMKDTLSINVALEEKFREQERLLLSVLPKHVATEMTKDFGTEVHSQFRKIYMSRYENVSILFADIVGFTALSSGCTAKELVKILNELFARFDDLAKKYHQMRIKILGDCYYCISGAPQPRSDHAVLSVHMGLSIVDVIIEVRDMYPTSGVNMRVGIHTGGVLAGVVGLKQWQFDVLGKEVTFANKMESGGLPGVVHISETTVQFLNGEFELEAGDGESREDAIKASGMKTFIVKSILKPLPQEAMTGEKHSEEDEREENEQEDIIENGDENDILYKALVKHDRKSNIYKKLNWFTLLFADKAMEREYAGSKDSASCVVLSGFCVVILLSFLAIVLILIGTTMTYIVFVIAEVLLFTMALLSVGSAFPKKCPQSLVSFANTTQSHPVFRTIWSVMCVLALASPNILYMKSCDRETTNYTLPAAQFYPLRSPWCEHALYYGDCSVLVVVAIIMLVQAGYLVRCALVVSVSAIHAVLYSTYYAPVLDRYQESVHNSSTSYFGLPPTKYVVTLILSVMMLSVASCRVIEELKRKLFLWRHEAEEQKEQIVVQRQKNEALVYNIMPAHIAKEFTGSSRGGNDLYSQSHEEVGVIFASCPNFNDFYTEDSVNNNGLEWIRFLNEVISDYDELLNEDRFKSIIKIKTVGSTYMAASGITRGDNLPENTPLTERWSHLADLVKFAFALRESLETINKQSFNNFVLRIGINHGPIISGVIGAKKPHFDIWGNTVNVSSRMDSTGKAGEIQVTEETMFLLKNFGFIFERRGLVKVKGKGELVTYFLKALPPTDLNVLNKSHQF